MLFNSYSFIFLFLPIVLFGFFWVARTSHRLAALWLTAASLFFYGWWNPKFVLLLLASIVFNYAMGYAIGHAKHTPRAKPLLISAITANLALLGMFKYVNFFISTVNDLISVGMPLTDIVLPLGISFFTFTQIAFLVDVYRGIAREYNFIHYSLFVTYFPHLIAGPVLHHKQMMPQFAAPETYRITAENVASGLSFFTIGLAKKVLLADSFAEYVAPVFDGARDGVSPDLILAWTGALSYTLQLYFDFSGYSDMAIGLSRIFGVQLPINFNSPYKAYNIIEFWRRWHMTLSQFLRDYLYIPLGGNRNGKLRRYTNLMATMLLGGLWHGANWTFVVWGGLHGFYLIINHAWHGLKECMGFRISENPSLVGNIVSTMLTFLAVVVAWVFFRAESLSAASLILKGMSGVFGMGMEINMKLVLVLILGLVFTFLFPNTQEILSKNGEQLQKFSAGHRVEGRSFKLNLVFGVALGVLAFYSILSMAKRSVFLYFQF